MFPLLNMSQWWTIMGARLCSFCHWWRSYKHVWLNFALLDRVCYSLILFSLSLFLLLLLLLLSLLLIYMRMTLYVQKIWLVSFSTFAERIYRLTNPFDQNKRRSISGDEKKKILLFFHLRLHIKFDFFSFFLVKSIVVYIHLT